MRWKNGGPADESRSAKLYVVGEAGDFDAFDFSPVLASPYGPSLSRVHPPPS